VQKESERKRERERLRRLREEKLRNLYFSAGFIKIAKLKKIECAGCKVCLVQVRNAFIESLVRRHKDSTPPETPRLGWGIIYLRDILC
jgi:hypothetical protein